MINYLFTLYRKCKRSRMNSKSDVFRAWNRRYLYLSSCSGSGYNEGLMCAGSWELGWVLCDIWISLDVLLCTASILSLCAISVDRYLAVTQPLNYSRRRRSKRLALLMILAVWLVAIAITCPPIFGWWVVSWLQSFTILGFKARR
jgi:hypothetical protein